MTVRELFDQRMLELYTKTGQAIAYWPHRFLQAVRSRGGLEFAKVLLAPDSDATTGFDRLVDAGRVDLSVEYIATRPPFRRLFAEAELETAESRLAGVSGGGFANTDWVTKGTGEEDSTFSEGVQREITLTQYERNREAREACLRHYGTACIVCGFDFEVAYGELGRRLIHVHHVNPISESTGAYNVDPVRDMVPVCANCHLVLHIQNPPMSVNELRQSLRVRHLR